MAHLGIGSPSSDRLFIGSEGVLGVIFDAGSDAQADRLVADCDLVRAAEVADAQPSRSARLVTLWAARASGPSAGRASPARFASIITTSASASAVLQAVGARDPD
jgi:hypothetical protein